MHSFIGFALAALLACSLLNTSSAYSGEPQQLNSIERSKRRLSNGLYVEQAVAGFRGGEHFDPFIPSGAVDLTLYNRRNLNEVVQSLIQLRQQSQVLQELNDTTNGALSVVVTIHNQIQIDICHYLEDELSDDNTTFNCTDRELDALLASLRLQRILDNARRALNIRRDHPDRGMCCFWNQHVCGSQNVDNRCEDNPALKEITGRLDSTFSTSIRCFNQLLGHS